MARHALLTIGDGIHVPYAWTYASASSREGATGFVSSDVGKLARQIDDNSLWMLVAVTPTWVSLGGGGETCASNLTFLCRKGSSGTIAKGSPVYLSGWNVGEWAEVELAKADAVGTMPAVGLARTALTNAVDGEVVFAGSLYDVDTSGWAVKDSLYVSAATAGTLTTVRPAGATSQIQSVARVVKVDATAGVFQVMGAGRTNALPNLTQYKTWVGDADGLPVEGLPMGVHAGEAESLAESSTTSVLFVQKVSFTTPAAVPAGRYRVGWSYEWKYDSIANDVLVQCQVDDDAGMILLQQNQEPQDALSWIPVGGFGYVTLGAGTHLVDLDYRAGNTLYSASIRRARLEFWRLT